MLLGKRLRFLMSRTISMKEFAADLVLADDLPMPSDQNISATIAINPYQQLQHIEPKQPWWLRGFLGDCRRSNTKRTTMIPTFGPRRNAADLATEAVETTPFLRSCGLCKGSLNLGCDIFMYRPYLQSQPQPPVPRCVKDYLTSLPNSIAGCGQVYITSTPIFITQDVLKDA